MGDSNYFLGFDLFCTCLVILLLPVLFIFLKSYIGARPNLSLLFGLGHVNADQPVPVSKSGILWLIAILFSALLFPTLWMAVQGLTVAPILSGLVILISILLLLIVYRYLYLAIQVERDGITVLALLDETKTNDLGEAGFIGQIRYTYADGVKGEIRISPQEAQSLAKKAIRLKVTYLDDRPLIHCAEWAILQETNSSFIQPDRPAEQDWRSKIPNSGLAQELIPRALAEFVRVAPAGGFIIFSDKATGAFVQFLMVGDALILDFSIGTKEKETDYIIRLHEFFARRNVKAEMRGNTTQSYDMDFPPTPDQVEKASSVALDIFEQVFLLDGMSLLEAKADV